LSGRRMRSPSRSRFPRRSSSKAPKRTVSRRQPPCNITIHSVPQDEGAGSLTVITSRNKLHLTEPNRLSRKNQSKNASEFGAALPIMKADEEMALHRVIGNSFFPAQDIVAISRGSQDPHHLQRLGRPRRFGRRSTWGGRSSATGGPLSLSNFHNPSSGYVSLSRKSLNRRLSARESAGRCGADTRVCRLDTPVEAWRTSHDAPMRQPHRFSIPIFVWPATSRPLTQCGLMASIRMRLRVAASEGSSVDPAGSRLMLSI
jgi:hypothetical protein